jgi:hypothetical protein
MAARAEAITKPFMMGRYRAVSQMRVAAVVVVYGMVKENPRESGGASARGGSEAKIINSQASD